MSRLKATGTAPVQGKGVDAGSGRSRTWVVVMAGVIFVIIVGIIFVSAGLFSLISRGDLSVPETTPATDSTSTTSSSTSSTATTSTSTSSSTTQSTSTTTSTQYTTTTSTTTTTLDLYRIAFCMSNKLGAVYLGNTHPSRTLELYFGEYDSIFPIVDCRTSEENDDCKKELREYIEDNELLYNDRPIDTVGYPAVVKGRTAYIIRSPAELEELLGCGSLEAG